MYVCMYVCKYVCMYETKFCPRHNSSTDGRNQLNFVCILGMSQLKTIHPVIGAVFLFLLKDQILLVIWCPSAASYCNYSLITTIRAIIAAKRAAITKVFPPNTFGSKPIFNSKMNNFGVEWITLRSY